MLEQIVIVSLIVFAIWASMQEGMIFHNLSLFLSRLPERWHKPAFECVICMGGVYGAAVYWIVYGGRGSVAEWLVVNLGTIGLLAVIMWVWTNKE